MQPDLDSLLRESRRALLDPDPASLARAIQRLVVDAERRARRRRAPLVTSAVLTIVLVMAVGAVAAERILESRRTEAPSRVLDRTLLCTTGFHGGLRMFGASAHLKSRTLPTGTFVGGAGGSDTLSAGLETGPAPGGGRATGSASYNRRACRLVSARVPSTRRPRVPLTARGLRGGAIGADPDPGGHPVGRSERGERYKCEAPPQVLIRIRAVFTRPTRWRPGFPHSIRAPGTIREGYLAVRTQSGRPLVFASVTQTRARLFAARSCWQD